MIMQLAILNGQTMESLWNRQEPLVPRLGVDKLKMFSIPFAVHEFSMISTLYDPSP